MRIQIKNDTTYSAVKVQCGEQEFLMKQGDAVSFETDREQVRLTVFVQEKNRVLLNFFFALIDGFFDSESVINVLSCHASFDLQLTQDSGSITLKPLEAKDGNQWFYQSVDPEIEGFSEIARAYTLSDTASAARKTRFWHIAVTSWLPIILFLIGYCLATGNVLTLIAAVLFTFIFGIPSWRKAAKAKTQYRDQKANELLCRQTSFLRQNGNATPPPTDIIGKTVYATLDKIFQKKQKK